MPFPTQEKTYETAVYNYTPSAFTDDLGTWLNLRIMKDLWQGQSHHGFAGTINEIVPNSEYELVATNRSGDKFSNESGDFTRDPVWGGSLVGRRIEITGATSGGNNGIFVITSVVNASTIRYTNVTGVAEAFSGDYRVSNGRHTARGGAFPYWVCKGSSAGSTGKGAGMDARDRWHTVSDMQLTSGATGNHSWFVLQNLANGVEILITLNLSTVGRRPNARVSCELGYTGGTTTTSPSAADSHYFCGNGGVNNGYWFMHEAWGLGRNFQLIFIHATDGTQDFMLVKFNKSHQGMFATGLVGNPQNSGGLIPWNGNNAFCIFPDGRARNLSQYADGMSYVEFNDSPRSVVTVDKDGAGPGPTSVELYLTAPMLINAMLGQHQPTSPDKPGLLHPGDRVGLDSVTSGYRGRYGYVPDLLWGGETYFAGVQANSTAPGDGSRLWRRFGHFWMPWDGSQLKEY